MRVRSTGDEEPYELSYLSPNKPSIPSGLAIWGCSSFGPVYHYHIAVLTIQQRAFDFIINTVKIAYVKYINFDYKNAKSNPTLTPDNLDSTLIIVIFVWHNGVNLSYF